MTDFYDLAGPTATLTASKIALVPQAVNLGFFSSLICCFVNTRGRIEEKFWVWHEGSEVKRKRFVNLKWAPTIALDKKEKISSEFHQLSEIMEILLNLHLHLL